LLATYETASPPARDRVLCLAATGPKRRSDSQEIHVSLEPLIVVNQEHSWERERWRWHSDSGNVDRAVQWGAPVPVEALAAGNLSAPKLTQEIQGARAASSDKAALAILLQDEGRLTDAVELYGVEVDRDLKRLCGGQKIYPPACCAYADEKWVHR